MASIYVDYHIIRILFFSLINHFSKGNLQITQIDISFLRNAEWSWISQEALILHFMEHIEVEVKVMYSTCGMPCLKFSYLYVCMYMYVYIMY